MKKSIVRIIALFLSVIVFTGIFSLSVFAKEEAQSQQSGLPVEVKGKSAVLMDVNSGKVLMAYNEHEKLPPASVTKIMPLLLVIEAIDEGYISLTDKVTASAEAASKGGSQIWLKEGETMTVDELLKAVAVASANDASAALGEYLAGSEDAFVKMMNDRAKELGMNDTTFVNCSGLDDEDTNLTSAYDIAVMSSELMKHDLITKYTTIWMDSLRDGATELVNTNKLVRFYNGTTGLKTGTTSKAGCCLSATAQRDGLYLCAVVLGSDNSTDRFETAKAMLNWGFSSWVSVKPQVDESLITDVKVNKGETEFIKPVTPEITPILVEKGKEDNLKQKITLSLDVDAPVEKGQTLGTVDLILDGEKLTSYPLKSPLNVPVLKVGVAFKRLLGMLS